MRKLFVVVLFVAAAGACGDQPGPTQHIPPPQPDTADMPPLAPTSTSSGYADWNGLDGDLCGGWFEAVITYLSPGPPDYDGITIGFHDEWDSTRALSVGAGLDPNGDFRSNRPIHYSELGLSDADFHITAAWVTDGVNHSAFCWPKEVVGVAECPPDTSDGGGGKGGPPPWEE